ncbi:hypothetical protein JKP88DRAFT_310845 [Tribonema minus]|uniref:Uncharacterized protein n=1 Tax=Tribonema minus TaxID=303371 RepID=A0A836CJM8_9STRA|nr:hypothetical protein JKP88DRAFT_310845 [Tribonema minus]
MPDAAPEEDVSKDASSGDALAAQELPRVADSTRNTYAGATAEFLRYLWCKKPQLLTPEYKAQFQHEAADLVADNAEATAEAVPSVERLRKALPRLRVGGGLGPDPLQWDQLTADDFVTWLLELKDEGRLSKSNMQQKRCAVANLFNDFNQRDVFEKVAKEIMVLQKGLVQQLAAAECSEGGGDARQDKPPLPFDLYQQLALAFLEDSVAENGHCNGPFGHLFFVLTWNLLCRTSKLGCGDILWQHLEWHDDALAVFLPQSKQTARAVEQAGYPDARHVYANPLNPEICPILSLGVFMMCYGVGVGGDGDGRLFTGTKQYDRYTKVLKRVAERRAEQLRQHGLTPDDLGALSSRGGAASYSLSDSTACPSSAAVGLRAGWVPSGVGDADKRYVPAEERYAGRCCAGLPLMSPDFMILHPFFSRYHDDGSARAGVDAMVSDGVARAFGGDVPLRLMPVAQYALASVLYHWDFLARTLPPRHRLFANALLLDAPRRQELQQLTMCVLGNSAHAQREQRVVTGLSAEVMIMGAMRDAARARSEAAALAAAVQRLNSGLEDRVHAAVRTLAEEGLITSTQMTVQTVSSAITQCLKDSGLHALVSHLKSCASVAGSERAAAAVSSDAPAGPVNQATADESPATCVRVPPDWKLPAFKAADAWRAWAVGVDKYGPYRSLQGIPQSEKRSWKRYKGFMAIVEKCITSAQGAAVDWSTMTDSKAQELYAAARGEIEVDGASHKRRHDQLKWNTVLKNYESARAQRNKLARLG